MKGYLISPTTGYYLQGMQPLQRGAWGRFRGLALQPNFSHAVIPNFSILQPWTVRTTVDHYMDVLSRECTHDCLNSRKTFQICIDLELLHTRNPLL